MNITYTQNGDYLIPNIIIRKTKPLGHYGRLRKAYLEMHRPILFNELVLSDKLFEHCAEIDETARNRMELIDLAFLHLDGSLRKRPVHPPEQRFIQRQLRRMAVEEHPRIRCAVLWYAHSASPLPAS